MATFADFLTAMQRIELEREIAKPQTITKEEFRAAIKTLRRHQPAKHRPPPKRLERKIGGRI